MVELQSVRVTYANGEGIDQITFSVAPGEMVFLVGPSGAGKSTVLKTIYMDKQPAEGHVVVGDYNSLFIRKSEVPFLRRKLGIVFQDFRLFADRDVFDNVAFTLEVIGARQKEIKRRVLRALADVGLSHKARKMPDELSGGEQQRVAIARAIVNEPLLLLADEPTGNLDPETAAGIMDVLLRINTRGTSILMATHNYDMVQRYRGRIIKINNGRLVA
ncbi:MAG: Cell division ATP-binding protein FtsE [bacterium ADurb.Bin431]|nr:MAG: Cell division ATP-binding protein FtsE [bacterium ADurb.Bin431]HNY90584.1 cell division ATP-binding protein FtsE [bacterium]HOC24078.1 cell division ATP-binding protein FtsE [bacterium]HOH06027.1 cell division ATP-binding protein FtsE [bacterium]HOY44700.1 cell division ATP-binding protein FtsE [bacterium]